MTVHIDKDTTIEASGSVPGTAGAERGDVRFREAERDGHVIVDSCLYGSEAAISDLRDALEAAEREFATAATPPLRPIS